MKKYLILGFILCSLVIIPTLAQATLTAGQLSQALTSNPTLLQQLRILLFNWNNYAFSFPMANLAVVSVATSTLSNCAKANVNGDNAVDALDTAYVQANLVCAAGSTSDACIKSDVNSNGRVDNFDILAVRGQFGCSVGVQATVTQSPTMESLRDLLNRWR